MTKKAQVIKDVLMVQLAKEGKTLAQFEQELANSSNEKVAVNLFASPESFGNAAKLLFSIYGGTALAAGALGGTGLYGAYKMNEDSTNQQLKHEKEKQQYQDATNNLKARMENPSTY